MEHWLDSVSDDVKTIITNKCKQAKTSIQFTAAQTGVATLVATCGEMGHVDNQTYTRIRSMGQQVWWHDDSHIAAGHGYDMRSAYLACLYKIPRPDRMKEYNSPPSDLRYREGIVWGKLHDAPQWSFRRLEDRYIDQVLTVAEWRHLAEHGGHFDFEGCYIGSKNDDFIAPWRKLWLSDYDSLDPLLARAIRQVIISTLGYLYGKSKLIKMTDHTTAAPDLITKDEHGIHWWSYAGANQRGNPIIPAVVWGKARSRILSAARWCQDQGNTITAIYTDEIQCIDPVPAWERSYCPIGEMRVKGRKEHASTAASPQE